MGQLLPLCAVNGYGAASPDVAFIERRHEIGETREGVLMVTAIFRAPTIRLEVEDRTYRLGDPIDAAIEIGTHGHTVPVRRGFLYLVCEIRRFETREVAQAKRGGGSLDFVEFGAAPTVPRRSIVERHESHIMDTSVFLEDAVLPSGVSTYRATVSVAPDTPLAPGRQSSVGETRREPGHRSRTGRVARTGD